MNVFQFIEQEEQRQRSTVNLIASENFASVAVRKAQGSVFTNKYAEGTPGKRYYSGCEVADDMELYCQILWQRVFGTDYHVNVQPHSGSTANLASYLAVLKPGSTILSMELSDGGHLSHGHKLSLSGMLYEIHHYGLKDDETIDYADLEAKVRHYLPSIVVVGASSYSRTIDFARVRAILDRVRTDAIMEGRIYEPVLMADIAHIAGLVAAGVHPSPFGLADIVTMTTHKTLRGARGGLIFCKQPLAANVDRAVFPGLQGGPLLHQIAGKAATAEEALTPEYREYIRNVVQNAAKMAKVFSDLSYRVVSGGTDNHLFCLNLSEMGITGREAQQILAANGILVNKNCVPNDQKSPYETSGIRIGTPAMTTMGWTADDFTRCALQIDRILREYIQKGDT